VSGRLNREPICRAWKNKLIDFREILRKANNNNNSNNGGELFRKDSIIKREATAAKKLHGKTA